jgi:hypothetical protein
MCLLVKLITKLAAVSNSSNNTVQTNDKIYADKAQHHYTATCATNPSHNKHATPRHKTCGQRKAERRAERQRRREERAALPRGCCGSRLPQVQTSNPAHNLRGPHLYQADADEDAGVDNAVRQIPSRAVWGPEHGPPPSYEDLEKS